LGKNASKEKIEGLGGNLKYYKTDFVEAEQTDKNKRKSARKPFVFIANVSPPLATC